MTSLSPAVTAVAKPAVKPMTMSVDVTRLAASMASGTFKSWYAPAAATISKKGVSLGLKSSSLVTSNVFSNTRGAFPADGQWTIVGGSMPAVIQASGATAGLVTATGGAHRFLVADGYTAIGKAGATTYEVGGTLDGTLLNASLPTLKAGDRIIVALDYMVDWTEAMIQAGYAAYKAKYIDHGIDVTFQFFPALTVHGSTASFTGTPENDIINMDEIPKGKASTVDGGAGDDEIYGARRMTVLGGAGNDIISSPAGHNTIDGGAGADTIYAAAGDVIVNADRDDLIIVMTTTSRYDDVPFAKVVYDISDAEGATTLEGGRFDDKITVLKAGRTVRGGGGADTFILKAAGTQILDLSKDDEVIVRYQASATEIAAWQATGAKVNYMLTGLRGAFDGGRGDDELGGSARADTLSGLAGNDELSGEGGDDLLDGGAGNDALGGGGGNDTLLGGAGNDILCGGTEASTQGTDADQLSGGAGNDTLLGGWGADILDGDAGNDHLDGGTGGDVMRGDGGNDTLWGGAGDDSMWAGQGNDLLYGGEGADWLFGDAGNDTISLSSGGDVAYGGAGNDLFVFTAGNEWGLSVIADFEGGKDRLDLSGLSLVDGFKSFGLGYDSASGTLSIDLNGDKTVDLSVSVQMRSGRFDLGSVITNRLV